MMSKAERKHNEHTKHILENPKKIGLENIVLSTREVKMFLDGNLYHQPDNLCFDPSTGTLYNIEYKNNLRGINKAEKQLTEQKYILKDVFNRKYKVINIFVYDNFKVGGIW